ncbi:MAG: PEP-CTERM sorting domain-containing protein [Akkermansiaceae bacterium]|nr:PEP-CTERM sorting domain-containing protein [Akkermansiaceae bacterium]
MIRSPFPIHHSALSLIAVSAVLSGDVRAATYNWLEANSTGGTGANWLQKGNYGEFPAPDNTGSFTATRDDTFIYNTGSRGVTVNSTGTIGKLVVGPGYTASNVSQSGGAVLTLESGGEGVTNAGIEILAGRTNNTNIHVRLNLSGDILISNNGDSRLRIGNVDNGNGGLQGGGTLGIRGGVILLPDTVSHTYSGAVTVSNGGTLQTHATASFTTYSSLAVNGGGSLTGAGTFAGATVQNGGRISPGGEGNPASAPAALTFTNLLTLQSTGLVVLDVKAAGADAVKANGGVVLGGELRIRLNSDYTSEGTYVLFQGLTGTSGDFSTVNIQTDATGSTSVSLTSDGSGNWNGAFTSRGYDVNFDANTGVLTLSQVPEPASALLGTFALLGILRRRR